MHRALLCFDILQEVFSYFAPHHDVRYNPWWATNEHWQFQHKDLASAARVCRAFSDPALDVLWVSLDSFLPLLRLFHALEEKPFESSRHWRQLANVRYYLSDDAVPDAAEWARFQQYAERVRSITYSHGKDVDSAVFMWLIGHSHGEPLLPRLQTLKWYDVSPQNNELLDVLPPSLHHLELWIAPDATERDDTGSKDSDSESSLMVDPSEQLVRNILTKTPLLQTLGIRSANLQALAPIAEYPHIHKLVMLGTPDLRALPTISSAEGLVELHIELPWDAALASTLPRGFRNLQHLKFRGSLRVAFDFLAAISPRQLLSLEYRHFPCDVDRSQRNMTSFITDKFPSLLNVSIHLANWGFALHQRLLDALRPLLQLRDLERVTLNFNRYALAWSDDDVRELGAAWPKLVVLQLHSPGQASLLQEDCPSIYALAELVRLCPRLTEIRMPPMRLAPPPAAGNLNGVVAIHVRYLYTVCTPCDMADPALVARFLDRTFPRMECLADVMKEVSMWDDWKEFGVVGVCKQWLEVLGQVGALQLSR